MSQKVSARSIRDVDWAIWKNDDGTYPSESVTVVVLMDIRAELQTLNRLLACPNFIGIPHTLSAIARNTTKRKRRTKLKRVA